MSLRSGSSTSSKRKCDYVCQQCRRNASLSSARRLDTRSRRRHDLPPSAIRSAHTAPNETPKISNHHTSKESVLRARTTNTPHVDGLQETARFGLSSLRFTDSRTNFANPVLAPKDTSTAADQIIEARNRIPWGGGFGNSQIPAPKEVSFNTLRKADTVSRRPIISTANNPRAFNFDSGLPAVETSSARIIADYEARRQPKKSEVPKSAGPITPEGVLPPPSKPASFVSRLRSFLGVPDRVERREPQSQSSPGPVDPGSSGAKVAETEAVNALTEVQAEAAPEPATVPTEVQPEAASEAEAAPKTEATPETEIAPGSVTAPTEVLAEAAADVKASARVSKRLKHLQRRHERDKARLEELNLLTQKIIKMRATAKMQSTASEAHGAKDENREELALSRGNGIKREIPLGKSLADAMQAPRFAENYPVDTTPPKPTRKSSKRSKRKSSIVEQLLLGEERSVIPSQLPLTPLALKQPAVPFLSNGLDRVLFNSGVHQLRDSSSGVYNFDPYLEKIMPVAEFDFDALKEYKTSSRDESLLALARTNDKRYVGSTSSMTGLLAHFHYLLSNWRPLDYSMLSAKFHEQNLLPNVTRIMRAPTAIFLRWRNGTYAIDADKEYDGANVLMFLGKSMELLMTLPPSDFEVYRKTDPRRVTAAQKEAPESFQYSTLGDFLLRSQLDAHDPRLPGAGVFDLKTRAVVSVRMQADNHEPMVGYEIKGLQGRWQSYEREYHDMIRSTMLKYSLQARMGLMNGIFVAYHNVTRIFGFQYIPIAEMDRALHGQENPCLGDQEYKMSLKMLNDVLDEATARFPEQSLRIHFEVPSPKKLDSESIAAENALPVMKIHAEPVTEEEADRIQSSSKAKVTEFERRIMGKAASEGEEDVSLADPEPEDASSEAELAEKLGSGLQSEAFDSESELKPLWSAIIHTRNTVNGTEPQDRRPSGLRPFDKWAVTYRIETCPHNRTSWAQYLAMKARRRRALAFEPKEPKQADEDPNEDPDDAAEEDKKTWEDGYLQMLLRMVKDGETHRAKIDRADSSREAVLLSKPLPQIRENIQSVDDYTALLYGLK